MKYLVAIILILSLYGCTTVKTSIDPSTNVITFDYKYILQNKNWSANVTLPDGKTYSVEFGNSNEPVIAAIGVLGEAVKRFPAAQ